MSADLVIENARRLRAVAVTTLCTPSAQYYSEPWKPFHKPKLVWRRERENPPQEFTSTYPSLLEKIYHISNSSAVWIAGSA